MAILSSTTTAEEQVLPSTPQKIKIIFLFTLFIVSAEYEHVGQNLGFINSSAPDIDVDKSMNELTMLWYDEVAIFESDWVNETMDRGPDVKVGHYTQMIWADTSEIGCAVSYYSSDTNNETWYHIVYVCNYGPGGNYLGLPVYEIGEPSSACGGGLEPSEDYEGLCGKSMKVEEEDTKFDIFDF